MKTWFLVGFVIAEAALILTHPHEMRRAYQWGYDAGWRYVAPVLDRLTQ